MLNKTIIMGRLTRDPELRTTNSGLSVTQFSVAVDRGSGDKKETAFIPCVAWRGSADIIGKYFVKGSMICLVGHLTTRNYDAKDGSKRFAMELIVDEVNFTGEKREQQAPRQDSGLGAFGSSQTVIGFDQEVPF